MTNEKVIKLFLNKQKAQTSLRDITNGVYTYKGRTLDTDGKILFNYNTIIAFWDNDVLYIDLHKYSTTTSKIQNTILRLAKESDIPYIEKYN